jgi:hypothetical protein
VGRLQRLPVAGLTALAWELFKASVSHMDFFPNCGFSVGEEPQSLKGETLRYTCGFRAEDGGGERRAKEAASGGRTD